LRSGSSGGGNSLVRDNPTAGEEKNLDEYERWFGAFERTRYKIVKDNINAIYNALFLKPIVLYYRGSSAAGPSDCSAEPGDIAPEGYFGATWSKEHLT
jgi:hypothetical protein